MKEIKSIIAGVVATGKVGDYILYQRLGVPCIRRASTKKRSADSYTETQRIGQSRLRYLVSLYQALQHTVVKRAWQRARKRPAQAHESEKSEDGKAIAPAGKDEVPLGTVGRFSGGGSCGLCPAGRASVRCECLCAGEYGECDG